MPGKNLCLRVCQAVAQAVEQRTLLVADEVMGFGDLEPASDVDLGDFDGLAGVWGPLDMAGVADEVSGIAITLECPRGNKLPTLLLDGSELEEPSIGGEASLFLELSLGCGEWLFVVMVFALWNRPGALVLGRPVGSSGMYEEDLEVTVRLAIHQKTCAATRHGIYYGCSIRRRRNAATAPSVGDPPGQHAERSCGLQRSRRSWGFPEPGSARRVGDWLRCRL